MTDTPDERFDGELPRALSAPSRRRLLALLRDSDSPRSASDLAQETGLHVTTVRFHLDVLRRAGLVDGTPQPRARIGRPQISYTAPGPSQSAASTGYPALATLLASHLADTEQERSQRAEQAGRVWACELTPGPPPAEVSSDAQAAQRVTGLFAELGFDPELTEERGVREIVLRSCPFRALARARPEVVCSVHLGLLRGSLTQLGAAPTTTELLPFVEPELCLVRLGDSSDNGTFGPVAERGRPDRVTAAHVSAASARSRA